MRYTVEYDPSGISNDDKINIRAEFEGNTTDQNTELYEIEDLLQSIKINSHNTDITEDTVIELERLLSDGVDYIELT